MSPFWTLLELRVMKVVVVTTGAITRESSSQNISTNKPTPRLFYRPDALPLTKPTVSKQ